MTKKGILEIIEQEDVEFIRLQFTDMFGNLKNVAVTAGQLERVLENKHVFECSALFDGLLPCEDDMYLYPDPETFVFLPWRPQQGKVARLLCDVYKEDGTPCALNPRTILKRVLAEAKMKGYEFFVDPECEFFLFHTDDNGIPTTLSHEKAGYMDVGPIDLGENARRDMVLTLEEMGFEIESSHHEKAPAQHEIDFREGPALTIADSIVTFRSAVRSIAKRFGLHATFMPKPKKGVAGSGMHMKISVYKDGRNIFNSDSKDACDEAKWFMGGIMEHAGALCAITNPLVNSYKRLHSGFEAPEDITWAKKNKNTLIRLHERRGEETKIELRFPDAAANPYLAIAACVVAGLEGIEKQISPGEMAGVSNEVPKQLPGTLWEALQYFEKDSLLEQTLGQEFVSIYHRAKLAEWNEYMEAVSEWEVEKYLYKI
ncbi:MAG: glutamine synthetase [Lachnospiraceae bacterium]|nr:glutamine synthetase [Lachnospiraceae bacterium]